MIDFARLVQAARTFVGTQNKDKSLVEVLEDSSKETKSDEPKSSSTDSFIPEKLKSKLEGTKNELSLHAETIRSSLRKLDGDSKVEFSEKLENSLKKAADIKDSTIKGLSQVGGWIGSACSWIATCVKSVAKPIVKAWETVKTGLSSVWKWFQCLIKREEKEAKKKEEQQKQIAAEEEEKRYEEKRYQAKLDEKRRLEKRHRETKFIEKLIEQERLAKMLPLEKSINASQDAIAKELAAISRAVAELNQATADSNDLWTSVRDINLKIASVNKLSNELQLKQSLYEDAMARFKDSVNQLPLNRRVSYKTWA